ncbi:MAG: IS1182 family transposase [Peptoniphilus lacydonensis]|uniref:IS1182 family transposase n=1 Tax=Peptoniphilus lacydonensis TaxID=1673725 RepID=UPI00290B7F9B|nr:IS1182 family transposase [Peptoniphilus lacydonensis]MDU5274906.1 IS1182 family transposase [Peptoniphilus lacydonensis]
MKTFKNTSSLNDYTLVNDTIQLRLNFNTEIYIQNDVKIRLVKNIIERLNLTELKKVYSSFGRKPTVNPVTMLQIIIFCYSEGIFSSRGIEKACKYDLRIKYLLDKELPPDHSTINRFRQKIVELTPDLLNQIVQILIEENQIDLSSIYIDGTKIEAYANRYSFVWRGSIKKWQEKLIERIKEELGLSKSLIPDQVLQAVTTIFNQLRKYCKQKKIKFVYGKGKRKTKEQRDYELLKDWKEKLESYRKHLEIMGDYRNSYSKTDHDATFMRMKEDHMKNGQLKPAYNIQLASASGFIIGENISHHPSDMYTLKPFLKDLLEKYPNKLNRIVADAGYESEENYVFLAENNLTSYIKPSNYEKSKTRKYKKEQEFRKSLKYDERQDKYISQEGKEFIRCNDRYRKRKIEYITITKVYRSFDWNKERQKTKGIYIAETFQKYREETLKNIIFDQGIEERLNRSIQAEGAFSKIKSGLNYNRFHHRGKENIISEICLLSIALNLNKLASKIENKNLEIIKYKAA